jgi:hypothetical protein
MQRVCPFVCAHSVCADCDAKLRSRGQGRCPMCREERTEELENDERRFSGLETVADFAAAAMRGGIIVMPNGRVFFPAERPPPLQVRRSGRLSGASRPEAPAEAPAEARVPVRLAEDAQQLVDALTDASGVNIDTFRRLASAWLSRNVGALGDGARRSPGAAVFSVVQVVPRNP